MSYEIKLEFFEGPLDLLLHLIHRNEISLTDIPIALITQQYLEAIELMKTLNLDVAGEYLVMAAYLTHVKSRMLLPTDGDSDMESQEEDPRDELVAHLLEYKRYKEAAGNLALMPALDENVFLRESSDETRDVSLTDQPLAVGLHDLIEAMKRVLERTGNKDLLEVKPERLLVRDKIRDILGILRRNESVTFDSLFESDTSRLSVVTTFLALLEIVKLKLVRLYQDVPFGTIVISRRVPLDYETDLEAVGTAPVTDYRW